MTIPKKIHLSQTELKSKLHYDPETGVFTWLEKNKYHPDLIGQIAGTTKSSKNKKYIVITIDGIKYRAHRLAFYYVHGLEPDLIDHKDIDGTNNKISNLRKADKYINAQNHSRKTNNSNLPVGVRRLPGGNFQSRITANNKIKNLGSFKTAKEASEAYRRARVKLHDTG